jgi:hypothetical protein
MVAAFVPALLAQTTAGLVAGPYLQLASSPGTMVVQVIQQGDLKIPVVAKGLAVRPLPSIPLATPGLFVRKWAVSGLKLGQAWSYSVGTKSYKAHGLPSGKVRLAVFGDSGRGLPGQRLVGKQLEKYDPDLIVHVGDIVYPRGRESEYLLYHFPVYGSILAKTASTAAPGNHDTAYRDLRAYPDGLAYYKLWHLPQFKPKWAKGPGNFGFGYGDAYWVILDSNTYINWKGTGPQTWLKQELAKGANYRWRFVAFHHPPFHSSDKKKNEVYMKVVAPIFEQGRVTAVFNGHVHNYQRTKPINGVTYFVTGAGGAELYDQKIAGNKKLWKPFTATYIPGYSFTSLEYDRTGATVRQIDSKGKVIDTVKLQP